VELRASPLFAVYYDAEFAFMPDNKLVDAQERVIKICMTHLERSRLSSAVLLQRQKLLEPLRRISQRQQEVAGALRVVLTGSTQSSELE
jgi:hypothetical protein